MIDGETLVTYSEGFADEITKVIAKLTPNAVVEEVFKIIYEICTGYAERFLEEIPERNPKVLPKKFIKNLPEEFTNKNPNSLRTISEEMAENIPEEIAK